MTPLPHPTVRALKYAIVAGMFIGGIVMYPHLPDTIPVHWNVAGQADGFQGKVTGVWVLPGMALLMSLFFPLLKSIDPKRENYAAFARTWEWMQFAIIGFFAYVYAMQLFLALQSQPSSDFVGRYVTFGIGVLFVVIGNSMGKIRQNYFIGLKTPWSLSDPEVWGKSQRISGWAFVIGGCAIAMLALFGNPNPWVFFGIIVLIVLLPIVYSYLIYKHRKTLAALLLLTALVALVIAAAMRLSGSEDTWVCTDGQWKAHGQPSAPMPQLPCPDAFRVQ